MSVALLFVQSPKKFNVHLCHKVPFVFACFQASARKLRLGRKRCTFGLGTQLTINYVFDFLLFEYGSRS
jgi:hypothetical protein